MQDYLYSAIGAIAIAVQLIINYTVMFIPESNNGRKAGKIYRALMLSVFAYYITDVFWGVLAGLNWIPLLFVDTTVYYVAMSLIIVCFYRYFVEYLGMNDWKAHFFTLFGHCFFCLEIIFLVVNFFHPCFFWFDENDAYVAGKIRYIALWVQVAMFGFSSLVTLFEALKTEGARKKRHLAIFFFSLIMLVSIIFQEKYPLLPFYALGCLLGSCVLHVYVVGDEQEEARQKLEAARYAAETASRAKTSFLFNMSHDIRTPMNAILGYTDVAIKHRDDPHRVDESLEKIKLAGEHLLDLINDILEMSRIEAGRLELSDEPSDIRKLIAGVNQMSSSLAISKSIDFKTEIGNISNPYVYTDELHANEVLINLTSNAVKYTPAGGKIRFRVNQLRPAADGQTVFRFEIEDNGIGMSEEFQQHLFEAFSREKTSTVSKQQGAGLGLSIVKRIVDLAGGTISVISRQNVGSTFTVEVPLRVMDEEAIRKYEEDNRPLDISEKPFRLESRKVLLVEDNEMNREIAAELLEEAGLIVDTAEDGEFAVKAVKEKGTAYYDFILMDIQMPVMDGYEATQAIRALPDGNSVPIIALSANAFEKDIQKSLSTGMNAHVAKPIDVNALFETMKEIAK